MAAGPCCASSKTLAAHNASVNRRPHRTELQLTASGLARAAFAHPFIHSLARSLARSFIHSFTCKVIHFAPDLKFSLQLARFAFFPRFATQIGSIIPSLSLYSPLPLRHHCRLVRLLAAPQPRINLCGRHFVLFIKIKMHIFCLAASRSRPAPVSALASERSNFVFHFAILFLHIIP